MGSGQLKHDVTVNIALTEAEVYINALYRVKGYD